VHAVFWSAEADERQLADDFFACLTQGTSFSGAWSAGFGLPTVVYAGSVVLPGTLTGTMPLSAVARALIKAFDAGMLPPPVSGVANEYISFTPSTAIVGGLCTGPTAGCGEHDWHNIYKGVPFDVASVPLGACNCHNHWATERQKTTEVAEHETGEGLARLAGAGFEVGDLCEAFKEQLMCCGSSYQVQQLAGARGPASCEPINSTGSAAACTADAGPGASSGTTDAGGSSDDASSGSSGSGSSPSGSASGAGSSSGSASGASSSSGSSAGSAPGEGPSSGASGSTSGSESGSTASTGVGAPGGSGGPNPPGSASAPDAGVVGVSAEGGALGAVETGGATNGGCACATIGDASAQRSGWGWQFVASIAGLALISARRAPTARSKSHRARSQSRPRRDA
jgi:hypothetical protein